LSRWSAPPAVTASIGLHAVAAGTVALVPEAFWWALGGIGLNHVGLTAAGLWPRSHLLGPNWTRLPPAAAERRQFALTLDDGPDPEVTPRVLDVLDQHRTRATFFCIAMRARAHPAVLREIVARGHDVQNHSHSHRHVFALSGPRVLAREVEHAQQVLADLCGVRPHCFRAPAGLRNPFLDPVLHRHGLNLVSWTRRGFDTVSRDTPRARLFDARMAGWVTVAARRPHAAQSARPAGRRGAAAPAGPRGRARLHATTLCDAGRHAAAGPGIGCVDGTPRTRIHHRADGRAAT
jgi:peptidoglycan/xylan/chitin deacetylase (PgdA/CDA1 family)